MSAIPALTDKEIAARVGETSFARGRQYFRDGAIYDTRRQGMTLKAHCHGSYANAYRVEATFDDEGSLVAANCSCPVGDGGYCKHTAALLLTWSARPEAFAVVEEVDAALEGRTREELIALIKQMLRRHPELEALLETPLPVAGKRSTPVDPEVYRRQAAAAFVADDFSHGRRDYDYEDAGDIAAQLEAIIAIGDGFVEHEDYASAAAVYEAVSAETLENYDTYQDEDGSLGGVLQQCVEGLGSCLEGGGDDAEARGRILAALFAIYRYDLSAGGIGLGDGVPELLIERTTPEERRTIAGWVREALPQGADWSGNWHRRALGGFLLSLEAEALDDETFLRICREMGRIDDLIDRLLALGRVDEARHDAGQASDYEMLGVADLFVRHGHAAVAEEMMLERAARLADPHKATDTRILQWLKDRYKARGDTAGALDLARKLFHSHPSLEGYREIRELATARDRWEALRPQLRLFLSEGRHTDLLIRIYLDEGEIDHALEAVGAMKAAAPGYGYRGYGSSLGLTVARAAEESRPRAALTIYQQHAERIIEQRDRARYSEACGYLVRVRDLYQGLGEQAAWDAYIAGLRGRTRQLRALKQEMAAAGL